MHRERKLENVSKRTSAPSWVTLSSDKDQHHQGLTKVKEALQESQTDNNKLNEPIEPYGNTRQ